MIGASVGAISWRWPSDQGMRAAWLAVRRNIAGALATQAHSQRGGVEDEASTAIPAHTQTSRDHWNRRSDHSNQGKSAFDTFFTRHEQPLYGYLRRLLSADEIAVEIAQEAFFRAWQRFDEVSAYDRPEAWLYRVATNLAISHLRRRHPLSFSHVFASAQAAADGDDSADEQYFAAPLDIERQTAERDLINATLRLLPERQRAALLLRAVQGFSCEEIASALGITTANARQMLGRAREHFRVTYEAAKRESE